VPAHRTAPGDLDWRVSRTCDSGACVMVARDGEVIVFGNTTEPGSTITYTTHEWREFIAGVKLGDFDDIG
jgi:predicted secreted Zn-dependent protease